MDANLATIIATSILTASVTLLSVYLTNVSNRKRESEAFLRNEKVRTARILQEKCEELYFLFAKWSTDTSSVYMTFIPVISGKMSEKDAWKIAKQNQYSEKGNYQKIDLLVNLYFPELIGHLDSVHEARDHCPKYLSKVDVSLVDNFIKRQENFDSVSSKFLEELSEFSRKKLALTT